MSRDSFRTPFLAEGATHPSSSRNSFLPSMRFLFPFGSSLSDYDGENEIAVFV